MSPPVAGLHELDRCRPLSWAAPPRASIAAFAFGSNGRLTDSDFCFASTYTDYGIY